MMNYRLDELGWHNFEWLCQSLLKKILGLSVEAWGGYSDFGRDAYCETDLALNTGSLSAGPFIFQCKFVESSVSLGSRVHDAVMNAIYKECANIRDRADSREIDRIQQFVFLTNAPMNADLRTKILRALNRELTGVTVTIFGGEDICRMLDSEPEIRQAFPQLLSLRDLDQLILRSITRPYEVRSHSSLKRAKEFAPSFVATNVYHKAIQVLNQHHFVMITGPPEVGKTTLGVMIGLQKAAEGWEFLDCESPESFFHLLNKSRPQVFIVDDVFGTTEYVPGKVLAWESNLHLVLRELDECHWFVWTSRTVPLRMALERLSLQGESSKFPEPGQLVVDARELSDLDKAMMLYRHAKSFGLNSSQKFAVKALAKVVVRHSCITPERIKRFVQDWLLLPEMKIEDDYPAGSVIKFVNHEIRKPTDRMVKSFRALEKQFQCFLFSILDEFPSPLHRLSDVAENATRLFPESFETEPALLADTLSEHFIFVQEEEAPSGDSCKKYIGWIHPSWRDLVIEQLAISPLIRRRFLKTCGMDGIVLAISQGGGSEGARTRPLLRSKEDYRLLEENLCALLSKGENAYFVLIAIKLALGQTGKSDLLRKVAWAAMESYESVWAKESHKSKRSLTNAESFYEICEIIERENSFVDVCSIWHSAWNEVEEIVLHEQSLDEFVCRSYSIALEVARFAKVLQPGLYEEVRKTSSLERCFDYFFWEVNSYLDQYLSLSTTDEYESEIEFLESINKSVYEIEDLFSFTRQDLSQDIEEKILELKELLDSEESIDLRIGGESDSLGESLEGPLAAPDADISSIFSDL